MLSGINPFGASLQKAFSAGEGGILRPDRFLIASVCKMTDEVHHTDAPSPKRMCTEEPPRCREAFLRVLDEFGCAKRDTTVGADVPDSPSYTNYLCTIKKFFAPARVVEDVDPYKCIPECASKFAGGASPSSTDLYPIAYPYSRATNMTFNILPCSRISYKHINI